MTERLDTVELQPQSIKPTAVVIWLHGLGADGNDFVPIVQELARFGIPPIRFIFPHAPQIPVTINAGYVMRAWYDILGVDLVRREDEGGIRRSHSQIEQLIEREVAAGIPRSRIVLAGFSQGGAITLHTGLRQAEPLAGLMALSTYLPLADLFAAERHAATHTTPVFMAHGSADPIVPMARGLASRDALIALGHPVEWHEYLMEHSVCEQEVADIAAFLKRVLG
ncbi:MAG: carboxylesterase [Burkholderiaceae bacterium]